MALSGALATAEALVQLQEQLADAYADLERCRARPTAPAPCIIYFMSITKFLTSLRAYADLERSRARQCLKALLVSFCVTNEASDVFEGLAAVGSDVYALVSDHPALSSIASVIFSVVVCSCSLLQSDIKKLFATVHFVTEADRAALVPLQCL